LIEKHSLFQAFFGVLLGKTSCLLVNVALLYLLLYITDLAYCFCIAILPFDTAAAVPAFANHIPQSSIQ
jgi:hypothetical protein